VLAREASPEPPVADDDDPAAAEPAADPDPAAAAAPTSFPVPQAIPAVVSVGSVCATCDGGQSQGRVKKDE
jgi:hypothetical protein